MTLEMRNWLFWHEIIPDIKYSHWKPLQKEVSWSFVGQLLVIILIFLKNENKLTSIMTSYDVRNEKLTILTWNNPRYQILLLKNITKGGIMVVFRSIISNFIDNLRKMTKNYVNNDVMWRQKWEIDCFDMK